MSKGKHKKSKLRLLWKIPLAVVSSLLVLIIIYVSYVFLSYSRIEDNLALSVEGNASADSVKIGKEYTALTYNAGFGAYTPDFTFFMDGGTQSWANSKESVINCINGVSTVAKEQKADFVLYQEVDTDSTRSYHVNEKEQIQSEFSGYNSTFAQNYHSAFLLYPLTQPHGKSNSGLLTLSNSEITSSVRRSLPISTGFSKILDLDRCYSVSHIPTENGKELVLYNVHLSAYGSDDSILNAQLDMLFEDMESEYKKGNYCICGGDFNHDFTCTSKEDLNKEVTEQHAWATDFPDEKLPKGFKKCVNYSNKEIIPTTRNCDIPYCEDSFTVILDGYIVSDNVKTTFLENHDTRFIYSDHNPVIMKFKLK